jgi:hypothetical protein
MFVSAAARAFLWHSLPGGFEIFDIAVALLFLLYLAGVWWSWATPKPGVTSHARTTSTTVATEPTSEKDAAAAAAAKAVAAAERADTAAQTAVAAAEKAVAAAGPNSADGRAMAASAIGSFVTLGVAAAAVLLTGAGVLLGVEGGATPLPRSVFTELVLATGWLVLSLVFGAISMSYVINHIHHSESVAENRLVVFFAAGQLAALVIGAVYFVLSIVLF